MCPCNLQPMTSEESSDLLPFALDESPSGDGCRGGLLAGAVDSEEALGAFVRMLEQAPPLHAPSLRAGSGDGGGGGRGLADGAVPAASHPVRMSLAAGLDQLAQLREALPAAVKS